MNHPHRDRLTSLQQALLSRRTLLRGALGASVAGLLAACGGADDNNDLEPTVTAQSRSENEPAATSTSSSEQSVATRSLEHAFGVVEIPVDPQRIITLDYFALEALLALEMKPIGASLNGTVDAQHEYIRDQLDGVTPVATSLGEPDLEKIAQLNPDIILGLDLFFEERRDAFERIAPITAFPFETSAQWKETFRFYADAIGRADEAQAVMAAYDRRVEEVRQLVGPEALAELEVSVVRVYPDSLSIYNRPTFIGVILEDVGFARPKKQLVDEFATELSFEQIQEADADVVFIWGRDNDKEAQNKHLSELENDPLFAQLGAVQNARAFFVDGETWIGSSILAANAVLDDLIEIFEGLGQTGNEAAAFPVSVEHKFGVTEIPEEPQRVVALGFSDQDPILALGVKPIAIRYWFGEEPYAVFPWAQDELGDAEPEVLNMPELDIEQIAALQPDLIIGTYSGITGDEYQTLSRIAPTIAQSGDYIDYGMPWQETTLMIGQALGRTEQARELVEEVEAQFETAREAHAEWAGKSVVLISGPDADGQYGFFASEDPRSRVCTSLGFVVPAELDELAGDQFYGTISAERLELFDRDLLVWNQLQWVEGGRAAIEAEPLVQQLTAMQEGRAVFIGGELDDALQFGTVLSLPFLLESLVPMLEAAMDGDPTTEATP